MSRHESACKVFIAAEGTSDVGDLAEGWQWRENPRRKTPPREGYFQPMLRKLLGDGIAIMGQKLTVFRREDSEAGKLHIHTVRAKMALALARSEDCQIVVFATDVDRGQGTKPSDLERKRRIAEMHAQIDVGFSSVQDADHICRIKATPLRMIEAWALGDAEAVAEVAGKHMAGAKVPSNPEEEWGDKRDPESNYPKFILKRALGRDARAEELAEIAERSRVEHVRSACPLSFAPFADEAGAAVEKLGLRPAPEPALAKPRARGRR